MTISRELGSWEVFRSSESGYTRRFRGGSFWFHVRMDSGFDRRSNSLFPMAAAPARCYKDHHFDLGRGQTYRAASVQEMRYVVRTLDARRPSVTPGRDLQPAVQWLSSDRNVAANEVERVPAPVQASRPSTGEETSPDSPVFQLTS